ncbi:MAG: class I SAM-dependent methyltransferase [Rhodospirillales bacterium]|nr:class I SAM-dependent methyltransferase [Rhodospirillales bacterium]
MAKQSIIKRVAAWVRGKPAERTRSRPAPRAATRDDVEEDAPEEAPAAIWPPQRLVVANRLWGGDFIIPGGEKFILDFTRMLGLSEATSMLNIGAGLGGESRAWAEDCGVWVDGLESIPELAELGMERSTRAGMQRKAPIKLFNPEDLTLQEKKYNAIVGFESFFTVANKEQLFNTIEGALRVDGHLLFTDFVLPNADEPDEAVRRWFSHEPVRPHLWTAKQVYNYLSGREFDVRVAEDISAEYRSRVLGGWLRLLGELTKPDLTPDFAEALIAECEFWLYRISAIDSGGLRVYRYDAIKLPEKRF